MSQTYAMRPRRVTALSRRLCLGLGLHPLQDLGVPPGRGYLGALSEVPGASALLRRPPQHFQVSALRVCGWGCVRCRIGETKSVMIRPHLCSFAAGFGQLCPVFRIITVSSILPQKRSSTLRGRAVPPTSCEPAACDGSARGGGSSALKVWRFWSFSLTTTAVCLSRFQPLLRDFERPHLLRM